MPTNSELMNEFGFGGADPEKVASALPQQVDPEDPMAKLNDLLGFEAPKTAAAPPWVTGGDKGKPSDDDDDDDSDDDDGDEGNKDEKKDGEGKPPVPPKKEAAAAATTNNKDEPSSSASAEEKTASNRSADMPTTNLDEMFNDLVKGAADANAKGDLQKQAEAYARAEMHIKKVAKEVGVPVEKVTKIASLLNGADLTHEDAEKLARNSVAAGRFMARGFNDESEKIAAAMANGQEFQAPNQVANDLDPSNAAIPLTGSAPQQQNADISQGDKATTQDGKERTVDSRLPGDMAALFSQKPGATVAPGGRG